MIGLYGLCLAAAFVLGCLSFKKLAARAGLKTKTLPVMAVLSAVLGALCSRLYYHAANCLVYGMGFEGYAKAMEYFAKKATA